MIYTAGLQQKSETQQRKSSPSSSAIKQTPSTDWVDPENLFDRACPEADIPSWAMNG